MDSTEIQRIIQELYHERLHITKFENLEEKDKFLEKCDLPKLSRIFTIAFLSAVLTFPVLTPLLPCTEV